MTKFAEGFKVGATSRQKAKATAKVALMQAIAELAQSAARAMQEAQ